ncbi:hypothetical protein SMF913_25100 [Streptomyces malaysiensis]|uniref:Uncharacterized protein n=1 Tax=Streptomyces malaysiensis TaxID=92644 RepID=A0A2J7YNN3_STRMQ|nr:hypothetical protein SMF913_25100 [Streptomyces malaysiensis]
MAAAHRSRGPRRRVHGHPAELVLWDGRGALDRAVLEGAEVIAARFQMLLCRSKSHRCTSCCMSVFVDEAAEDPGAQAFVHVEVMRRDGLFVSVGW